MQRKARKADGDDKSTLKFACIIRRRKDFHHDADIVEKPVRAVFLLAARMKHWQADPCFLGECGQLNEIRDGLRDVHREAFRKAKLLCGLGYVTVGESSALAKSQMTIRTCGLTLSCRPLLATDVFGTAPDRSTLSVKAAIHVSSARLVFDMSGARRRLELGTLSFTRPPQRGVRRHRARRTLLIAAPNDVARS